MSEWRWIAAVFGAFCAYFTVGRLWQKDNIGAMKWGLGIVLAAASFLSVGCSVTSAYRPWMEAGVAYDTQHTVGNDPVCIVRLRQPLIPERLVVGYTHHSSCPDSDDRNTIDQIEIVGHIPLGRLKK